MEKIICNNKFKKICSSFLVFLMLFNFVFPSCVWADYKTDIDFKEPVLANYFFATGSIQDIMLSGNTTGAKTIANRRGVDRWTDEEEQRLIKSTKDGIKTAMRNYGYSEEDCSVENIEKVFSYYKNSKEVVSVKIKCGKSSIAGEGSYAIVVEGGLEEIEVSVAVDKIDFQKVLNVSELEDIDTKSYKEEEDGSLKEVNTDSDGKVIPDTDPSQEADLGGILLAPIFALVNFIADAVLSSVGSFMEGKLLSNVENFMEGKGSLTGILVPNPPKVSGTSFEDIDVTTSSFIPDIVSFGKNLLSGNINKETLAVSFQYPNITYSPEEIFAGKIGLLSIDFISGKQAVRNDDGSFKTDEKTGKVEYAAISNDGWIAVRNAVTQWYRVLMMVGIIGLLSVLIYTGIKILISANSKDKAKYKEWILNWIIAAVILFSMHFIMAFIISIIREITTLLGQSFPKLRVTPSEGGEVFCTNLIGLVRFMIQSENFYIKVGYEVMYIALISYTIKFTLLYLKRVMNMAFLTLVAPIVALTYPIDKINDGKAQGFEMWLKEYIFNALLQPMHFILYYILVGSAVKVAAYNPLYGIAVLAFLSEGERLLKRIFGFDKASGGTVGGLAGAFATGAVTSKILDIARFSKLGAGNGSNSDSTKVKPITNYDMNNFAQLPGGQSSSASAVTGSQTSQNSGVTRSQTPSISGGAGGTNMQTDSGGAIDSEQDPRYAQFEAGVADWQQQYGIDNQELDSQPQQPVVEPQQPVVEPQQPVVEPQQPVVAPQQSVVAPQQPVVAPQQSVVAPQQPVVAPQQPVVPPQSAVLTEQQRQQQERERRRQQRRNGMEAVKHDLLKPVWDTEHTSEYNSKRLLKKAGRAALGVGLGTAAAAVQAGLSITDGKYSPLEGVAAFGAGYAGAGQITKGMQNLVDTYNEGTVAGDKKAAVQRTIDGWDDNEKVIEFNKENYKLEEIEDIKKIQKSLVPYGLTLDEMKAVIKYGKVLENQGVSAEEAYKMSANICLFNKSVEKRTGEKDVPYDEVKKNDFIEMMVRNRKPEEDEQTVRQQYENAFKLIVAFDSAQ